MVSNMNKNQLKIEFYSINTKENMVGSDSATATN